MPDLLGMIMMEHPLGHLPLLVALGRRVTALIGSHKGLPFGLSRQGGQTGHGGVPIEVGNGLDNHHKVVVTTIDLHLEDAYLTLPLLYLGPEDLLGVAMAILLDQLRIVGDIQELDITLGRLCKSAYGCSVVHI